MRTFTTRFCMPRPPFFFFGMLKLLASSSVWASAPRHTQNELGKCLLPFSLSLFRFYLNGKALGRRNSAETVLTIESMLCQYAITMLCQYAITIPLRHVGARNAHLLALLRRDDT